MVKQDFSGITGNKEAAELIARMLDQKNRIDEGILDTLSRLMELAEASGDDAFLGFVHYHTADSVYALEIDYSLFRYHIGRAILFLRRAGEDVLLTRAFNYAGVDASNNGDFAVAYFHMMNALDICKRLGDEYLQSIVTYNIGQVFARIDVPDKALEYVRLSNDLQQRSMSEDDIYYYQNIINGFFAEGVLNIALGNLEDAKKADAKIRAMEEATGNPESTNVSIPISFLRLQIAILEEDADRTEHYCAHALHIMRDAPRLFGYFTDIRDLCMFLIKRDRLTIVRSILDTISDTILSSGVHRMKQLLSGIEIEYYKKTGEREKLTEYFLAQHDASEELAREQKGIYLLSMEIVDVMNELRQERSDLEERVRTDSLTGIPNRYGMEYSIESVFGHAQRESTSFAVEILDINGFKEYNDTYGHQAGDECLRSVAQEIETLGREEHFDCARYGGDEFVMIFENRTDEDLLRIAGLLNDRLEKLNIPHKKDTVTGTVTVSQGICNAVPSGSSKPADYLARADKNLYQSKNRYYEQKQRNAVTLSVL